MKSNSTNATVSLDEALAIIDLSNLSVSSETEAQAICKDTQPYRLAKISVKEPDEDKKAKTIIGWISKDENHAVDAEKETRYSALRVELTVLEYL